MMVEFSDIRLQRFDSMVTLSRVFAGVSKKDLQEIRKICGFGYRKDSRAEECMQELNRLIGGYGVQNIRGDYVNGFWQDTVMLYVNMGDTYSTTVVFDTQRRRFYVTSYGDYVEFLQRNGVCVM